MSILIRVGGPKRDGEDDWMWEGKYSVGRIVCIIWKQVQRLIMKGASVGVQDNGA